MGLDAELTVILHEIVQFLESLRDTNLSSTMETVRQNLLLRSKNALSVFTRTEGTISSTSSSAEPYLRMNASSKGLLPLNIGEMNEFDMPEYVGAEETTSQNEKRPNSEIHPDYYETFSSKTEDDKKKELEESQENTLVNIYSSLSASQAKSKALKCGILFRKEGRKLFVFEQYRINWVALVGSHLLIYGNERDNKPYIVKGVRGYSGRPAPNIVPRDQKRSEAAFEIFKPGNKTLQFIARTPKDMEQWVAKICQVGSCDINNFDLGINSEKDLAFISSSEMFEKTEEIITKDRPLDSTKLQTTFSNVNENKTVEPDNESKVQTINENTSPPPLPARIPRSLPPLPSNDIISSYETMDNEEDDIYHRIEDLGDGKFYQNFISKNQKEIITIEKSKKAAATAYDDVQAILQKERQTNMKSKSKDKDLSNTISNKMITFDKTYDDINTSSVIRDKNNCESLQKDVIDVNESQSSTTPKTTDLISYDNVETLANAASDNKLKDNKNNEIQKKTPTKKSFLDRMRNKKESPQKREKIITAKRETLTPPPQIIQAEEVTTYDDVSDLIIKEMSVSNEMSEYICPPAPRPVYVKPPTVIMPVKEEFYDDVNGCHEKRNQQIQSNTQKLENRISDDCEHYKLPRNDTWQQVSPSQMEEQIYDDVAILANFTARQKEISDENKDQDSSKASTSPDKRSWNRFSRKHRSSDSIGSGTNKRISNEITDLDCFEEQQNLSKMNTFQKLINKMENSLGKVSPKAVPTTSVNKSCGLNSSS